MRDGTDPLRDLCEKPSGRNAVHQRCQNALASAQHFGLSFGLHDLFFIFFRLRDSFVYQSTGKKRKHFAGRKEARVIAVLENTARIVRIRSFSAVSPVAGRKSKLCTEQRHQQHQKNQYDIMTSQDGMSFLFQFFSLYKYSILFHTLSPCFCIRYYYIRSDGPCPI